MSKKSVSFEKIRIGMICGLSAAVILAPIITAVVLEKREPETIIFDTGTETSMSENIEMFTPVAATKPKTTEINESEILSFGTNITTDYEKQWGLWGDYDTDISSLVRDDVSVRSIIYTCYNFSNCEIDEYGSYITDPEGTYDVMYCDATTSAVLSHLIDSPIIRISKNAQYASYLLEDDCYYSDVVDVETESGGLYTVFYRMENEKEIVDSVEDAYTLTGYCLKTEEWHGHGGAVDLEEEANEED